MEMGTAKIIFASSKYGLLGLPVNRVLILQHKMVSMHAPFKQSNHLPRIVEPSPQLQSSHTNPSIKPPPTQSTNSKTTSISLLLCQV